MLAKLQTTGVANSQAQFNARTKDIFKLLTGQITDIAGLNQSVWEIPLCVVVATIPGNWTVLYSTAPLDSLDGTTPYTIILSKPSTVSGKSIQFKFVVSLYTITAYTGTFLSDGSGTNITTDYPLGVNTGIMTTGVPVIVASNLSSIFLTYSPENTGNYLWLGVERTHYDYDLSTNESLSVMCHLAGTTVALCSNIYSPRYNNYGTFTPTVSNPGSITVTRDSNCRVTTPLIPIYLQNLANGWAGGNLSTLSQVFQTADGFGKLWDRINVGSKYYRIVPSYSTLRVAVAEE